MSTRNRNKKASKVAEVVTAPVEIKPTEEVKVAGPTTKILIEIKQGQVLAPRVIGDTLKRKDVRTAISLAGQLLVQRVFESHKGDIF